MKSLRPDQLVTGESYWLRGFGEKLASLDFLDPDSHPTLRKLSYLRAPGDRELYPYGAFSYEGEQFDLAYKRGAWHVMGLEDEENCDVLVLHKDPLMHLYLTREEA